MSKETSMSKAVIVGSTFRNDAITDKVKVKEQMQEWTIDTCFCGDTQEWETGLRHPTKYPGWVIVEQYGSRKGDAYKGHKKWVAKVKAGEDKFEDVVEYGW